MIHYLKHTEIDFRKWDDLIAQHGLVYAQSWYLDIVHPNWEALILGDYEAVMPLTGGKKFGVRYLFQPFFVQQLGIFSRQPLSPEMQSRFLQSIPQKFRFCEIRLNESNALDGNMQDIGYHRNIVLDLNRDYDTIRANYHNNTRRNLVKALGNHLEISYGYKLCDVIALFRANRGARVGVWGDAEYATLERLYKVAVRHDAAFVVGVRPTTTHELLCGGLYLMTDSRVIFLFSGCSERGRQLNAMTLMMDEAIKDFSGKPVTFDFEGSDDDNLARFYLGFGGEERCYPAYSFNTLPPFGNVLLKAWKKWR